MAILSRWILRGIKILFADVKISKQPEFGIAWYLNTLEVPNGDFWGFENNREKSA